MAVRLFFSVISGDAGLVQNPAQCVGEARSNAVPANVACHCSIVHQQAWQQQLGSPRGAQGYPFMASIDSLDRVSLSLCPSQTHSKDVRREVQHRLFVSHRFVVRK